MKRILIALAIVGAIAGAACNDRQGVGRPMGLTVADTSGDSTPPGKPGPVASVTVLPPNATVAVGDSAGFFADLRDANGNAISDPHVKWSVADPSVARIEGAFGQSAILRALRLGSTTVTARNHGKTGSAQLVVDSLPSGGGDSVATVTVVPSGRVVAWTASDPSVALVDEAGSIVVP